MPLLQTAKHALSVGESVLAVAGGLVVAGGLTDRSCLLEAGFTNVINFMAQDGRREIGNFAKNL